MRIANVRRAHDMSIRLLAALMLTAALPAAAAADVLEIDGEAVIVRAGDVGSTHEPEPTDDPEGAVPIVVPDAAITQPGTPLVPVQHAGVLAEVAAAFDISPILLEALVWQESRWNVNAVSPKGARGLAQLMPATARSLGVDAADPRANLIGGARYLRSMLDLFDGDVEKALAAYNAGPGRVLKARGIPAITETRTYVTRILERLSIEPSVASPGAL